ncbi:MAG TPA: VWA domain-containing protein [Kouleothrix sp.]|uniref:vWA domain-containing protein n=1 Tax=Kouleothrix sp. TaxID=2779161 RepID=UPI002BE126C3|nr:VWA domain-containing protein [Kouleothrix sp.]HRC75141.1 VWA domain-containing protein [Kouleothrix sp.]
MDDRIIQFIDALRASGVRVSVAESADALRAIEATGIADKELFRLAMRATLVKEAHDIPEFEKLFPSFFGTGAPPMPNQPGGGMSQEDRDKLAQMLEQMLANMTPEQLRQLFEAMMSGENMSREQLQQLLSQYTSQGQMTNPYYQPWMTRRAMRELQFDRLDELLQELLEKLREAGVSEEALQQLAQEARENQSALAEQIGQEVGANMLRRAAEERRQPPPIDELLDRPFDRLRYEEIDDMRAVITRLAAQLRSRAALRQRRGNRGQLDAKATIRANQRFAGVPLDVRHKKKHLKPKLTVICDLSTSMRPIVAFMLMLVYALQDQVSRTRSYAFVSDLFDISNDFNESRPDVAIEAVQQRIRPGYYNTDLGNSLATFARDHLGTVDRRTTVIVLGDGRNNHNDPNLRDFEAIRRRARKLVWFNPEHPRQWGTGDSDMLAYVPLCDAVHRVSNLRELVDAVDSLFVRR